MIKTLSWIKKILGVILGLTLTALLVLWVSFYFWKKDAINDLPKAVVIKTENGDIEYSQNGDFDRYVLMVHGTPGNLHNRKGPQFDKQDYTTLRISRPGYSHTPLSSGKTPKEQADLYESLLDILNIKSVYVYGLSGGGPSCIQFALDNPERCTGLILHAAVSEKIESDYEFGILEKLFNAEFGTWIRLLMASIQEGENTMEEINKYIKANMLQGLNGLQNDLFQFSKLEDFPMEKISIPVLLIHGTEDEAVPFSSSQNAARRIPNATLIELRGKNHFGAFSYYSDSIDQEIFKFLENQEEKKN